MYKVILIFIVTTICIMDNTKAQDSMERRLHQLKEAMVNPEMKKLDDLAAETLSYGHSNGFIENKNEFISSLVSGKYNFLSIDISEQEINIVDNIAIVRHKLYAETHDKGKEAGTVKLKVLLIWQLRNEKEWVLLARQAVKNVD